MLVHKCDLCKKEITKEKELHISHNWQSVDLCKQCSKPILRILSSKQIFIKKGLGK